MSLIQKNVQSTNDLQELKLEICKNVDDISDGVDDYAERFSLHHEATAERNLKLTEQLSQMEQETQELQVMLKENRTKLLYGALTGVYSRMAYDERISQELARWTRYQTPFNYVILDIDHFKRVNDSYGHNAGDKALKLVAQMMLKYVRQSDYVFRIGGEEFVLLLTSTSADNASIMVEKMRAGIAASSFHFKGEPINLTLSAGITETRADDDVEAIYERADKALYKAKNSGRNCQILADYPSSAGVLATMVNACNSPEAISLLTETYTSLWRLIVVRPAKTSLVTLATNLPSPPLTSTVAPGICEVISC